MDPLLWIARKLKLVQSPGKNPHIERRMQEIEDATLESRRELDAVERMYKARTESRRVRDVS